MNASEERPEFRGVDPRSAVRIYHRHLPHWRQIGATYFVTFRLGDSVPKQVALQWREEDRTWLEAHGVLGPRSEPKWQAAYAVIPRNRRIRYERCAARRLHVELDRCHGSCLLRRSDARAVVESALLAFHGDRCWVGDWVVMPNHVHGLFKPRAGHDLEELLGSIKGYISTRLTKLALKSGKLWQQETFDRLVRDEAELRRFRDYIRSNPATAGLREGEYALYRCQWLDREDGPEDRPT